MESRIGPYQSQKQAGYMKKNIFFLMIFAIIFSDVQAQKEEQDWPNLARYQASNENILASNNSPEVVFMGNSITQGWAKERPDFFKENNIVGRGIGGQTTPQMLIRFTPDVIDLKPEVVVILAGTNDVAGNTGIASVKMITDNLKAMAQLAKANDIKVVMSSILPVYQYAWRKEVKPVEKIAAVNKWIKQYAAENGHVYLDYFPAMADERDGLKAEYSGDGVHPNEKGFITMEPLVLKAIEEARSK